MGLAYNLGSIVGGSFRDFSHRAKTKPLRSLFSLFLIFMAVNDYQIPDYVVQDYLSMTVLFFGLAVIYGAIGFRIYLIGRGISKVGRS